MQQTPIGWTDFSVNLIKYRDTAGKIVWACVHASAGCIHCYAQALALRWNKGKLFTAQNMEEVTPFFDEVEATRVLTSPKIIGKRVFVNDMTDWMGPWLSDELIDKVMCVFARRPDVIFQTLTKHASRQCKYMNQYIQGRRKIGSALGNDDSIATRLLVAQHGFGVPHFGTAPPYQPPKHVHFGVSVEDQPNADKRISALVATPAAIRWISAEPMLAPINLDSIRCKGAGFFSALDGRGHDGSRPDGTLYETLDGIVIGGESGPGHRVMPLDSAISLARQAVEAGVSVFFKQDSGARPGKQGRVPDDVWALKQWPSQ